MTTATAYGHPGGHRRGPRAFALANQKGGVGKTTTAINLGTALAAVGNRVLIVDLDPQGNASTGLGIEPDMRRVSTADVLVGRAGLDEAATATTVPGLFVAPATLDLRGLERDIIDAPNRAYRLRDAILNSSGAFADDQRPDYVLIDCPPSLNLLTINALAAANAVLVPVQCEFFALEGLAQLKRTIDEVRDSLNPGLDIQGVVLTMYDKRNRLADDVAAEVRSVFGKRVYEAVIPRNVRVAEAPSYGKPILLYDHRCAGSQAYIRLASELIDQERALQSA